MAGLNFGQIVEAALSGGLQGYAKQKQVNTENDLAQQKLQTERAGMAAKMAPEGLGFDDNGNVNYRSDFYTPGTPAYEAGSRSAQLKREQNYRYGGGMPAELAVALQRGQPVPDQYKNYEIPGYELAGLKPAGTVMNPNNQLATPEQKAAYEAANGKGTAGNLTAGAFNRNANAQLVGGMAAGREGVKVDAEADRQDKVLKQQKDLHAGQYAPGPQAEDHRYGTEHADWEQDRAVVDQSISQLRDAASKFRNYKPMLPGISNQISGRMPGTDLYDTINQAQQAIGGNGGLKNMFQGRTSNLDVMLGLRFAGNPNLTPEQNAKEADRLADAIEARRNAKDQKATFYEQNGTVYGYGKASRAKQGDAPAPSGPPLRSSLYPGADQSGGTDQIDPAARAASDQKLNIPPGIQKAIDNPDLIAKKEYSAKTNKTRITLKDGTKAVLSGDLR